MNTSVARLGMWLQGLALLALLVPVGANAQVISHPLEGCPRATVHEGKLGKWTVYPAPEFPAGPTAIKLHTIDTRSPNLWFVSNGLAVLRSADRGCTFQPGFVVPQTVRSSGVAGTPEDRVTSMAVDAAHAIYFTVDLLATETALPGYLAATRAGTALYRSEDGGRTWQFLTRLAGLPTTEEGAFYGRKISKVIPAANTPARLYVLAGAVLYRSDDRGATFTAMDPPGARNIGGSATPYVDDVVADPLDPDQLWARDGSLYYRSLDGGRNWERLPNPVVASPAVVGPAIQHYPGEPAQMLFTRAVGATSGPPGRYYISGDGGESFEDFPAGNFDKGGVIKAASVGSFAVGNGRNDLVMTTTPATEPIYQLPSIYRYDNVNGQFVDIDEPALRPLFDAIADRSEQTRFYFRGRDKIALFEGPEPSSIETPIPDNGIFPPEVEDLTPCEQPAAVPPDAPNGQLEVGPALVLPISDQFTLSPARLTLPQRTRPVDIYFVLDTSGSMQPSIDSVKASIGATGAELVRLGFDIQAGLAEFNGLNIGVPYRRLVDIGPIDCKIPRALERIVLAGGDETHLLALNNAVTGAGGPRTRAGKQANFREGAAHIVLHTTDEAIRDTQLARLTRDDVARVFIEKEVLHVGLNAGSVTQVPGISDPTVTGAAKADLDDLGVRTRTLAPAGGIDCDGNPATANVAAGQPVTCDVGSPVNTALNASIGAVVRQVVAGLASQTAVKLKAEHPDYLAVDSGEVPRVDLTLSNDLSYSVGIRCKPEGAGLTGKINYSVVLGSKVVASAEQTITCGTVPTGGPPGEGPAPPPSAPPPTPTPAPTPAPAPAPAAIAPPAGAVAAAVQFTAVQAGVVVPAKAVQSTPTPLLPALLPPPPATIPVSSPATATATAPAPASAPAAANAAASAIAPAAAPTVAGQMAMTPEPEAQAIAPQLLLAKVEVDDDFVASHHHARSDNELLHFSTTGNRDPQPPLAFGGLLMATAFMGLFMRKRFDDKPHRPAAKRARIAGSRP